MHLQVFKTAPLFIIILFYNYFNFYAVVGEVFVLSKLFKAALIAYVSSNAPRQLHLYHFGERRNLTTTNYPNSILSVLMNRSVCFILW